jgi:hypothetical protein
MGSIVGIGGNSSGTRLSIVSIGDIGDLGNIGDICDKIDIFDIMRHLQRTTATATAMLRSTTATTMPRTFSDRPAKSAWEQYPPRRNTPARIRKPK